MQKVSVILYLKRCTKPCRSMFALVFLKLLYYNSNIRAYIKFNFDIKQELIIGIQKIMGIIIRKKVFFASTDDNSIGPVKQKISA